MSTTEQTQTGVCACGAPVARTIPAGRFGEIFGRTPFVCDPCIRRHEAEENDRDRAFERDAKIRRAQVRLHEAGIPGRFDHSLGDLAETPAAVAAGEWVVNGGGLLLHGPVGVGKTHLAAGAARSMIDRGRRLRWLSGPLLFARLGSGMGTPERDQAVKDLTGRHALVLDDIDKSRPTEYGAENVFLAVDSRVGEGLPLLVTANLSVGELAKRWPEPHGEAIASRLAGYCRVVGMVGHDRRLAA